MATSDRTPTGTSVTSVCLGCDPQRTRLGLALVEFEAPHRALWADTVSIDEPDGGWRHEQVRRALARVEIVGEFGDRETHWAFDREITRIGIEQPPWVNNVERFRELCEVVGIVQTEAHRRWPWAPQIPLSPGAWKKAALGDGKGRATKAEYVDWAHAKVFAEHLTRAWEMDDDSAAALGIAVAAAKIELAEAA